MAEMSNEKRAKIIESFTPEQKAIYDNLVGDESRLINEFKMCSKFYGDAISVAMDKSTGQEVRLFLRAVSDYWQRRMKNMERSLELLVGSDKVRELKNAKN